MATDLLNKNKEQGIIELFKKEFLITQGTLEQLNELWDKMKETMDENDEDAGFVWEWCSYGPTWMELMEFIRQLEDELEDELYS